MAPYADFFIFLCSGNGQTLFAFLRNHHKRERHNSSPAEACGNNLFMERAFCRCRKKRVNKHALQIVVTRFESAFSKPQGQKNKRSNFNEHNGEFAGSGQCGNTIGAGGNSAPSKKQPASRQSNKRYGSVCGYQLCRLADYTNEHCYAQKRARLRSTYGNTFARTFNLSLCVMCRIIYDLVSKEVFQMNVTDLFLPLIVVAIVLFGAFKGIDVFTVFLDGAKGGFKNILSIAPSLIALMLAVSMLRESGALKILCDTLSPVASFLGIPSDIVPLTILSPISGSGSLSIFEAVMKEHGPDSFVGQCASVIMGSTETTFYAITLYYGSIGIKKSRHTLPSALCADFTSFIISPKMVRLFLRK